MLEIAVALLILLVVAFYTDALTGFAFFMTVTSVARLRGRDT